MVGRAGQFVIRTGRGGTSHFVLMASNGRVVVTSETYESKESCMKGIDAVKRLAGDATVVSEDRASRPKRASKRSSATMMAATSPS
jgi:uncharacterized protein